MQNSDYEGQADILELLYDRYPIRLPLSFIAIAVGLIFVSIKLGPGPVEMLAGCAAGLILVSLIMLAYGFVILFERRRRLLPQVCPHCQATEKDGTVYVAIQMPQIDRQIVACSRCEMTWRTDMRR